MGEQISTKIRTTEVAVSVPIPVSLPLPAIIRAELVRVGPEPPHVAVPVEVDAGMGSLNLCEIDQLVQILETMVSRVKRYPANPGCWRIRREVPAGKARGRLTRLPLGAQVAAR